MSFGSSAGAVASGGNLDSIIGGATKARTFADKLGPNLNGMNGVGGFLEGLGGPMDMLGGLLGGGGGQAQEPMPQFDPSALIALQQALQPRPVTLQSTQGQGSGAAGLLSPDLLQLLAQSQGGV